MVFAYYAQLKPDQQRIYRRSELIHRVALPKGDALHPRTVELAEALKGEDHRKTTAVAQDLVSAITGMLRVAPVRVEVLKVRPSHNWGELHGLYTPAQRKESAHMTLWMRTAKRRRVVAFRTFLRTLVHELCHHMDYTLLQFQDSFHTAGFYKRESSIMHQVMPNGKTGTPTGGHPPGVSSPSTSPEEFPSTRLERRRAWW